VNGERYYRLTAAADSRDNGIYGPYDPVEIAAPARLQARARAGSGTLHAVLADSTEGARALFDAMDRRRARRH
jgi:hypothetical protein